VTTDFEVIEQTETGSVVSAVAVRNAQLAEIAAPLLKRDYIPRQVTVYAAQRASTYAPKGNALLIYPEGETVVSAVTENGKLSLLPESWRLRRLQLARRGEWRKWLIWAGAAYAGLLFLFLACLAYFRLEIGRLDRHIARDAPKTEFVRAAEANWKALAPAVD